MESGILLLLKMLRFDFSAVPLENNSFAPDISGSTVSAELTFIGKFLRRRARDNKRDGENTC